MILLRITLPFPVSVNALYNGGSGQKRFPSKKYKAWLAACPPLPARNFDGVVLFYKFFYPDNRARDAENLLKGVSDYLVKCGVIRDDCWQCVHAMQLSSGGIDKANPRVEITISKAG